LRHRKEIEDSAREYRRKAVYQTACLYGEIDQSWQRDSLRLLRRFATLRSSGVRQMFVDVGFDTLANARNLPLEVIDVLH